MIRRFTAISATLAMVCLTLASTLALGPPASAQGCNSLDGSGTVCRLQGGNGPARPQPGGRAVSNDSPPGPTFSWLNLLATCDASTGGGWTSLNDLDSAIFDLSLLTGAAEPVEPGVLWIGELIDPATGGTNTGFITCVGASQARPALPPPLPTADDIWGAALTFQPEVNLDPYIRGLTGLETRMWYEGQTADSVGITLNGYSVTADIAAVEFIWDMGEPSRTGQYVYRSTTPGSADTPAASHTYAQPGPAPITHQVVWAGTSVVTGPGLPAGGVTVDLGTATLAVARDYDVIEVRAPVVRGPEGSG